MVKIYHNQRCSKSRQTLEILKSESEEVEVIDYQVNPPSKSELKAILAMLGIKAYELLRRNEAVFKEQFKGKDLSEDEWVEAMISYPKLIERPIVVKDGKAVIGRPPEKVKELL